MKITAIDDISNVADVDQVKRFVTQFQINCKEVVNGNIDFTDNCRTALVSVTFTATNTNTSVSHGLGRVPRGFILVGSSVAMNVYNGSGTTDGTSLSVKADATGTASLLVF
jgi:hypothetical protein